MPCVVHDCAVVPCTLTGYRRLPLVILGWILLVFFLSTPAVSIVVVFYVLVVESSDACRDPCRLAYAPVQSHNTIFVTYYEYAR